MVVLDEPSEDHHRYHSSSWKTWASLKCWDVATVVAFINLIGDIIQSQRADVRGLPVGSGLTSDLQTYCSRLCLFSSLQYNEVKSPETSRCVVFHTDERTLWAEVTQQRCAASASCSQNNSWHVQLSLLASHLQGHRTSHLCHRRHGVCVCVCVCVCVRVRALLPHDQS